MCCASGASHGSSKCSSTTSISGHTARSGTQGSFFGSAPAAHDNAPPTNVPGNGKAMLAHTPSCLLSRAPRCVDRRWVSHRSMPRVGTETTSGAIGSSSGSATRRASSDTKVSARSDRWTRSIPRRVRRRCSRPDGHRTGSHLPPARVPRPVPRSPGSGSGAPARSALGKREDDLLTLPGDLVLVVHLDRLQVAGRRVDR